MEDATRRLFAAAKIRVETYGPPVTQKVPIFSRNRLRFTGSSKDFLANLGEDDMIDRYTKAVLTLMIAIALIGLVVQRIVQPALAQDNMCTVRQPCVPTTTGTR
jgi:precorrin-4 methylase